MQELCKVALGADVGQEDSFLGGRHEELGQPVEWRADGAIAAGFRITADGAGLDATLEGLLADREPLQARLLALMGMEREA